MPRALDERTVASWRDRAGKHCEQVHHALIEQGKLALDEPIGKILPDLAAPKVFDGLDASGAPKLRDAKRPITLRHLMMVSSRLWLGGVVSLTRDSTLADRMMGQVRACSQATCALLVSTDGWAAYPNSIQRAFRDKIKETVGRGRACLRVWPQLCIATVIKRTENKRVVEITRRMTQGLLASAEQLLEQSQGGTTLNTAFIERLNGTMRERLASLTRKCRHAAHRLEPLETGRYLIGWTDNLCFAHHELSHARHFGFPCTPAMAAGLTHHIWSIGEALTYKMAPAPWVAPKRVRKTARSEPTLPKRPRGRPRIHPLPDPSLPKRPRGRPRKAV